MIANPEYVRLVQALPDPSPALQAYIAATLENDGTPDRIDTAQDAYRALSLEEKLAPREISRSAAS